MGSGLIKAFIIHLSRSDDRRAHVHLLQQRLKIPSEITEAIDAKDLNRETIDRSYISGRHKPQYPFNLSTGEIACFLSHRKAWQSMVDQTLTAALVLEDDVTLGEDFDRSWTAALSYAGPNSFIRFPVKPHREKGDEILDDRGTRILRAQPVGLGMHAQLIGIEAAKRLLAVTDTFDRPVDTTLQMNWVTGLSPVAVLPSGVGETSTNLGGSTIHKKKSFFEKLLREVQRPIYRLRVAAYSKSLSTSIGWFAISYQCYL
jgi:GR25 family glycosyltransferase involved in LPS biosynthesis